jgi:septum formation protein
MGKPVDADDAFRMLDKIRGTYHFVLTGICLIDVSSGKKTVISDVTSVHCVNYSDDDIRSYISTSEPYDKAGSYGIQAKGALLVKEIRGDYFNIVGLPIGELNRRLKEFE